MRITSSYVIAAGLALAIVGWLASGQLGAGRPEDRSEPRAEASGPGRPAVQVRVRDLVAAPVELEVVINGRTEAGRVVELRAETDGRVIAVGPERGAAVAAGEVLVTLDPRERRAMLSQAEATLRQREIEFEAASQLGAKGFQSETRVAEARAALETAKAQLERMRVDLEHTEIKAPFDGILERRPVEIGDFVDIGDPVGTILDQDPFLVVGQVAERDVGRLQVGMPGEARLVTGRTVEGRLRYIASQADPATRTFRVELEVPSQAKDFAAGLTAELRVAYGRLRAHRLPASLLALDEQGRVGIKAVDHDDQVVFHPVEIVRAEGDTLWVAGLPERLRVITVGQGFVRAGDEVRPILESALEPSPQVAERSE